MGSHFLKDYVTINEVRAKPMTWGEYHQLRGWQMPRNENLQGYLVENFESPKSNHPDFQGHINWFPKDVFEESIVEEKESLNFGDALGALKDGHCVARMGWNGKNMFLFLVVGESLTDAIGKEYNDRVFPVLDAIYMKTADDKLVPWLASQTDVLAEDWKIISSEKLEE